MNTMIKKTFRKNNIGGSKPVFLIAEVGVNHNGDIKTAFQLMIVHTLVL